MTRRFTGWQGRARQTTGQKVRQDGCTRTGSSRQSASWPASITRIFCWPFTLLMLLGCLFLWPLLYAVEIANHACRGLALWLSDIWRLIRSLAGTCLLCWQALRSRRSVRLWFAASSLGSAFLLWYFMPSTAQLAAVLDFNDHPAGAILRRDNLVYLATLYVVLAKGEG